MTAPQTQSPTDLKRWQIATDALAASAATQLSRQLAGLDWSAPGIQTVANGIYSGIVTAYARSSSVLSLQMYGQMRADAQIPGRAPRIMAPDLDQHWLDAKVDSAFKVSADARQAAAASIRTAQKAPVSTGADFGSVTAQTVTNAAETVSADEPVDISGADLFQNVVTDRLVNSTQRMVASGGRTTVAMNAAEDGAQYTHAPTKPGAAGGDPAYYVRVPTSMRPCAFCVMMATRDADWRPYKSLKSAGEVVGTDHGAERGRQRIGDRYHDHCQCIAVPVFADRPYVFDRQPYFDMYDKAAAQAGNRKTKDVLAAMRQIYGIA